MDPVGNEPLFSIIKPRGGQGPLINLQTVADSALTREKAFEEKYLRL